MKQSIHKKILSTIYGNGRGWAFSKKDFSHLGSRGTIDITLFRLTEKGTIRWLNRGIYDYPLYSQLLQEILSPDFDQVARALARKFSWSIRPTGPAALNYLGLSTQVPARIVYLSDGPNRDYKIGSYTISFKHTAVKGAKFKQRESSLIVEALKSLGKEHITSDIIEKIRAWLNPNLRSRILKDTKTVTDWIYEVIKKICTEDN